MYVRSLKISGFMSFNDMEWKPGRLTVLIGPNGSGKSNLLRAFELLQVSASGNLRDFVLQKGGLPRLLWAGLAGIIEFEIITDSNPHQPETGYPKYTLSLESLRLTAGFRVALESVDFSEPSRPGRVLYRNENGWVFLEGQSKAIDQPMPIPETATALSMVSALWPHRLPYLFQLDLGAWAIYHDLRVDERAEIRRPAVVREEKRISPDGQNLIPVLKTLYHGDFKDAIDAGMSAAFPDDYKELLFRPTEPNRVQLYVRRKYGSREDSAADLSDGTMRFLLLLAILAPPDPPPLIAIDEPESGLHPSMLPIIAEFAVAASARTQVILSTHSPQMLDAFGETLPSATIFNWAGDHTELKTVSGQELKKWVEEYSLGRFIFSGEAAAVL
jgi:predicted ATPase